jgi:hypothetical protein
MSKNYLIVLFKNKKKRKIIKHYSTEKKAINFYEKMLSDNGELIFYKKLENATPVEYQLALITKTIKTQKSIFFTDDFGRNVSAELENKDYVFLDIKNYRVEERIFDWQTQEKITIGAFIKKYCPKKEVKSIFTLHNKICVQIDSDVSIFSLKDSEESIRFLDVLQKHFFEHGRVDAIFVKDVSTAQRKWIYDVLEKKGFDKKRLYRLKTTFSKR